VKSYLEVIDYLSLRVLPSLRHNFHRWDPTPGPLSDDWIER
jgi:hypothetical protein